MKLIYPNSLAKTLDSVNNAFFYALPLDQTQRDKAARWIAARQGIEGSYLGMFAPTKRDLADGIRVFTGEKMATRAGVGHILSEEACRALILLGSRDKEVLRALEHAQRELMGFLPGQGRQRYGRGMYCCVKCSVALWRHLSLTDMASSEPRLAAGVRQLRARRDGKGRWQGFPFYYTLLALLEMEQPWAKQELRYALKACERVLKRNRRNNYDKRRQDLAKRISEMPG